MSRVFSEEVLANCVLTEGDAQAFRESATKQTLQDAAYKDSITFYYKPCGEILVESFHINKSKQV